MKTYTLNITSHTPNPNYEDELTEYRDRSRYYNVSIAAPSPTKVERELVVTLTEDEFNAVRHGVLEQFK